MVIEECFCFHHVWNWQDGSLVSKVNKFDIFVRNFIPPNVVIEFFFWVHFNLQFENVQQ